MLLGIHLSLLIGPTVPLPAPIALAEALSNLQVNYSDSGHSGFELTFQVGRAGPLDLLDYKLVKHPLLKPFNRVIALIRFNILPEVLLDGIITQVRLSPSNEPGTSTLTVTGEDVSVMMDLEETAEEYPAHFDYAIVTRVLGQGKYSQYGLVPPLPPPDPPRIPVPTQEVPNRAFTTDRAFLEELAQRYGYLFYITPGLGPSVIPTVNKVFWGPPERLSLEQSALSMNMGPETNVDSLSFTYNALAPNKVKYTAEGQTRTLERRSLSRTARPLARDQAELRRTLAYTPADGMSAQQAEAEAQGMLNRSLDEVVTATGTLDALRYGKLLKARQLVGVRGVGQSYDGTYYVKQVTHQIQKGQYRQSFTLTREGTGATLPVVRP
jgi:hypothetical protein